VTAEIGWRTYYLFREVDIDGSMIDSAHAVPDSSVYGPGGWQVAIKLTPLGADRFEEVTGNHIKRRFAILLDDEVESAPVILSRIPGGHATITMGAGKSEDQRRDALRLEATLGSGELPAPLVLVSEQQVQPSLPAGAVTALTAGAMLAFAAQLVWLLWLAFRPQSAAAPSS
jgi:preprotein translocase subunit SecD